MTRATVYVIRADHGVKVGLTILPVEHRLTDLQRATGLRSLEVVATFPFESRGEAYRTEQVAHWLLRDWRTIGEWFSCSPEEAREAITHVIEHGVPLDYYRGGDDT